MMKRLTLLFTIAAFFLAATPAQARFFGIKCHANQILQVDPIAQPGVQPSAHLHVFCLATNVTKDTTLATLEAGGTSAFQGGFAPNDTPTKSMTPAQVAGDTAGQWTPQMYLNGTAFTYAYTADYWSNTHIGSSTFTNMPEGLQMIGGQPHGTGPPPEYEVYYDCQGNQPPVQVSPVGLTCSSGVQVHIEFPPCWDGTGLTPSDVAYPPGTTFKYSPTFGKCVAPFPVQLPHVQVIVHTGKTNLNSLTLSSGPWYTMHADYWQAWNQPILQADENFLRTGIFP